MPFFDPDSIPYVFTLTATGLNIVNVKARRTYSFKHGKFKDFCFQVFGEFLDPVARLVYSEVQSDGIYHIEQLNLTNEFYRVLRIDSQL